MQYSKYRNSGIEWIRDLPAHWELKRLKYVATVQPSNVDKRTNDEERDVLLCNYLDVYKNEFVTKDLQFMKASATEEEVRKFEVRRGDVIVTKDSETPDDIAKPAFVKDDLENVICGYHLAQIRTQREIFLGEYLFRVFLGRCFNDQFMVAANGITRYGLSVEDIANAFVPIPPPNEQLAIANYLDAKTAQIDDIIAKKQKLIEVLREERTAIINQAVTKGLNPNAKMKRSGVERLGKVPESWIAKKAKHCFRTIGSGTTPRAGDNQYYSQDEGTNWLQTGDLNDGEIVLTSKRITEQALKDHTALKLFPRGSVAIAMYGVTIGKVGILKIEATTNQACCVFADPQGLDPKLFFYWILASRNHILSNSYGGGQPNINKDILASLWVACPTGREQDQIVDYLDRISRRIETAVSRIEKEIELLQGNLSFIARLALRCFDER